MTLGKSSPQAPADYLRHAQEMVEPHLRRVVDQLDKPMRTSIGYHYGWWDDHGHTTEQDRGKGLRPAVTLLCTRAAGAEPTDAIPGAVAVELVHNFSLIHDDVMDGDAVRRHRPTVWSAFDVPSAILSGDALLSLAGEVLSELPATQARSATGLLFRALRDMVNGQGADLRFETSQRVGIDDCVAMALGKTGALIGCSAALGALLAGADSNTVEQFRRFGVNLGLAFQISDDVLGIWGESAATGKPTYSDIRARKKSFPIVAALTANTPSSHELDTLYHAERTLNEQEVALVASLVDQAGGRRWAREYTEHHIQRALSILSAEDPSPEAAAQLAELSRLVADRDH